MSAASLTHHRKGENKLGVQNDMNVQQVLERMQRIERKLYSISYGILKNNADCEDALQEALIKVWRHRDTLRNEAVFERWVIRIVINECKQLLRRTKRHRHSELHEQIAAPPEPDRTLYDALLTLEDKYRLPIILHHLEDYPIREVAEMLDEPIETIKSQLCRGRMLLKAQIGEEEEK